MEFKGHPSAEELSSYLRDESPRCAVIVAAAYFEEALGRLLGDKKDRPFAVRINDALEWGLLTANEHADLNVLRGLRNGFAHDLRVRDFDASSAAKVEEMETWKVASDARPLDNVIEAPLDRLLFVVGTISLRLNKRTKPNEKAGPLNEPEITDFDSWPPVTSI